MMKWLVLGMGLVVAAVLGVLGAVGYAISRIE